ncbi:hypothetical protein EDD86DRAFT_243885 [Gorgonomyces haynaldii]|nr:hypothetical protein EDD86DRAFT_243885 [Gorgonomyces haynaldii]
MISHQSSIESFHSCESYKTDLPQDVMEDVDLRRKLLKKSISKLSLVSHKSTLDMVRIYTAIAQYDYDPPLDPEADLLPLLLGQKLNIFGTRGVADETLDSLEKTLLTLDNITRDVDAGGGWCQAENENGEIGFFLEVQEPGSHIASLMDQKVSREHITSFPQLVPTRKIVPSERSMSVFEQVLLKSPSFPLSQFLSIFTSDPIHEYISHYNKPHLPVHTGRCSQWTGIRSSLVSVIPLTISIESTDACLKWSEPISSFESIVHSPQKRRTLVYGSDDFVSYKITTKSNLSLHKSVQITVERRFTDFSILHQRLCHKFPPLTLSLPKLPSKQVLGSRFEPSFVFSRQKELQHYLSALLRHPILRSEQSVIEFLSANGQEGQTPLHAPYIAEHWNATDSVSMPVSHFYDKITLPGVIPESFFIVSHLYHTNLRKNAARYQPVFEGLAQITKQMHRNAQDQSETLLFQSSVFLEMGSKVYNRPHESTGCWKQNCPDCQQLGTAFTETSECFQEMATIVQKQCLDKIEDFGIASKSLLDNLDQLNQISDVQSVAQPLLQVQHEYDDLLHPGATVVMASCMAQAEYLHQEQILQQLQRVRKLF